MSRKIDVIAVDLTPILPGGENGGAKVFVIELLKRLAKIARQTQFVLLTNAVSHEELSILDHPNMRRMMVISKKTNHIIRSRFNKYLALTIFPYFPSRIQRAVSVLGNKVHFCLKRWETTSTLLHKIGADLLFCPFTAPTYFEFGIPTVCTIYDLQFKTYPEFFTTQDVISRENAFSEACRKANVLTAISEYSRSSTLKNSNLNPNNIRTIYLRIAQRVEACKKKYILNDCDLAPKRYLIYPANFWKHKNHEMLLAAFGIACKEAIPEDIKLVFTGTPGERQKWLEKAVYNMRIKERVLFKGYIPTEDLASLIRNSAGVIFPSLYEGFGLPVIEAMVLGVPVACSNTTSLPEVAGNAAILFDPRIPNQIAKAIVDLVKNNKLRKKLIQAGKNRSVEFLEGDRMAREYWELFQYALKSIDYENQISGAYNDGWASHCLSIKVAPAEGKQKLEIEFSVPDWLPQKNLIVRAIRHGKRKADSLVLMRGTDAILTLPIDSSGECLKMKIAPTFVPARSGHGNDHRELSTRIKRCGIVRCSGEYVELYPHKAIR